jgi:hypothetical protein
MKGLCGQVYRNLIPLDNREEIGFAFVVVDVNLLRLTYREINFFVSKSKTPVYEEIRRLWDA